MIFDFSGVSKKSVVIATLLCIITFSLALYILFTDQSELKSGDNDIYAQPKTAHIKIGVQGFEPRYVTVEKGTTVIFDNKSASAYWISPSKENPLEGFGSEGVINPGQSYSFTYEQVGSWAYYEQAYGKYSGVVDVRE